MCDPETLFAALAADSAKLATVPAGASITTCFISDEIDFTSATVQPFGGNWPSLPGCVFVPNAQRVYVKLAATTFLTNGSIQMGNNATYDNICPAAAQPNAATLNANMMAAGQGGWVNHGSFAFSAAFKLPDLSTPPSVKVNTAVTGTAITECKGRLVAWGLVTALMVPV